MGWLFRLGVGGTVGVAVVGLPRLAEAAGQLVVKVVRSVACRRFAGRRPLGPEGYQPGDETHREEEQVHTRERARMGTEVCFQIGEERVSVRVRTVPPVVRQRRSGVANPDEESESGGPPGEMP